MITKKRTYNTRLIKETLSYSTQEIANQFKLHSRTVQGWYKTGLTRIDNRKPSLVIGSELKRFIKERLNTTKCKCRQNEFYCLKCKSPQQSLDNTVDIKFYSKSWFMVNGRCFRCHTKIHKIVSMKKLHETTSIFMIQQIHDRDLIGSLTSILETDIKEVVKS